MNYPEDKNEEEQEEMEDKNEMTENDPVAFAELTSTNGWKKFQQDNFSVMAISETIEVKNSVNLVEDDLNETLTN